MTLEEQVEVLTLRVEALEAELFKKRAKAFKRPTARDVEMYAASRGEVIKGDDFVDFYQSKGWLIGKNPMKCWKSAARNWIRRQNANQRPTTLDLAKRNSAVVTSEGMGWLE